MTLPDRQSIMDSDESRQLPKGNLLTAWLFALALFGYPLAGALTSVLQVDSRAGSIPFRLAVILLGLLVIARARVPRGGGARTLLMLLWAAYSMRLIHDTFAAEIQDADYALMFFFAGTLLPSFALLARAQWQQNTFARTSLLVSGFGCLAMLLGNALGKFGDADLTEATGRLTVAALSPISLGHLAASTILCALVLWRSSLSWGRLALVFVIFVAGSALIEAGSKGPAVALGVCLLAWSLRRVSKRWPILLVCTALAAMAMAGASGENPLVMRLSATSEDESTFIRLLLWKNTITQIAGSPLLGSAFVELESGFYPHNVILESALAMGLPLTTVFTGLLLLVCWRAWNALASAREDLLGLLFIQALLGAMVSGSLYGATMLWVTLALLIRCRRTSVRGVDTRPSTATTSSMSATAFAPG